MRFPFLVATHFFSLQLSLLGVGCTSNSFWAIHISPDPLFSMTYRDFGLKVYEHIKNPLTTETSQKRYFYTPIALLDHKSANVKFNKLTKRVEMRFPVEMWSDQLQSEVVNYIPQIVGHEVKSFQVQVLAFEKVLLTTLKPSTIYSVSTDWHPYQLEKSIWFTLTFLQEKIPSELEDIIHQDPEKFDNLKLLFSLLSQMSKSEEIVINFKNIVFGQTISKILQKFDLHAELYLTAEDVNRLLTEMTSNVIMERFDDSDIVSPYSESQIYNIINDLLVSSKTTITVSKQDDILWKYVFWSNDFYRPDKVANRFNEIYRKLDAVNQKKMKDSMGNPARDLTGLKEEHIINSLRDHVEWNGQAFTPKPLLLYKIDLENLRNAQKIQDRRISVRYSTAALAIPIRIVRNSNDVTKTDGWAELKKELKGILLNLHQYNLL